MCRLFHFLCHRRAKTVSRKAFFLISFHRRKRDRRNDVGAEFFAGECIDAEAVKTDAKSRRKNLMCIQEAVQGREMRALESELIYGELNRRFYRVNTGDKNLRRNLRVSRELPEVRRGKRDDWRATLFVGPGNAQLRFSEWKMCLREKWTTSGWKD